MALLKVLQVLLVEFNCALQLLNILCPSLPKRGLRLSVALLALLGRRIYLHTDSQHSSVFMRQLAGNCGGSLQACARPFSSAAVAVPHAEAGQVRDSPAQAWRPTRWRTDHLRRDGDCPPPFPRLARAFLSVRSLPSAGTHPLGGPRGRRVLPDSVTSAVGSKGASLGVFKIRAHRRGTQEGPERREYSVLGFVEYSDNSKITLLFDYRLGELGR
jgi:hypothetical protein